MGLECDLIKCALDIVRERFITRMYTFDGCHGQRLVGNENAVTRPYAPYLYTLYTIRLYVASP